MKYLITLALSLSIPAAMAATNPVVCNDAIASMTKANKLKVIVGPEHRIFKSATHVCSVGKLVIKTDEKKYVVVGKAGSTSFTVYKLKRTSNY